MTIVAQTATAEAQSGQSVPPPAPTATATLAITTVSVSVATNCRTGPDAAYQLQMIVQPGSSFQVVGKYTPNKYWIINMPTGGTCWLWGEYATVTGDTAALPEIAAPAPPPVAQQPADSGSNSNSNSNSNDSNNSNSSNDSNSGSDPNAGSSGSNPIILVPVVPLVLLPAAPTNLDITRTCKTLTKPGDLFPSFEQTTTFTWTDASSNETGFSVFKDGVLLVTTGPNAQQYIDKFTVLLPPAATAEYGVQAVSAGGNSVTKTASVKYCQ
jgi:hypothetical protein